MIRETVLYYAPAVTPQTAALKGVLVRMGIRIRTITSAQANETVGYLAGIEGFEPSGEMQTAEALPAEEVLVLHKFTEQRLDELLRNLRRANVRIALKAVVTAENCSWPFHALCTELQREHAAMSARQKNG